MARRQKSKNAAIIESLIGMAALVRAFCSFRQDFVNKL